MLFSKSDGKSDDFMTVKVPKSLDEPQLENTINRISTLELNGKRKQNVMQNNLFKKKKTAEISLQNNLLTTNSEICHL